jgi:hypothetical protein
MKLRGHYEKPSEKKPRQKAEAIRRARKLARKKMQREGLLPKPRVVPGHAAGGAGSRGTLGARNGHTTAPFADECQSFLDNVIAGLGADWIIYSGRDPRRA